MLPTYPGTVRLAVLVAAVFPLGGISIALSALFAWFAG
jgi:hypothetical protein